VNLDDKLSHLDLFTGIMGFSLAAHWAGWKTVAVSEIDPYCCELIKLRMPGIPNLGDIKNYEEWEIDEPIDVITGGYPCQGESIAGKRRGTGDDRWLWYETLGIIKKFKPIIFMGENVAGHVSLGLDEVCASLEDADYEVQPVIIPACAVNGWHRRDRVWIIAYSGHRNAEGKTNRSELEEPAGQKNATESERSIRRNAEGANSNANDKGLERSHGNGSAPDRIQQVNLQQPETFTDTNKTECSSGRLSKSRQEEYATSSICDKNAPNTTSERQSGQGEYRRPLHSETDQAGETITPSVYSPEWSQDWTEVASRTCVLRVDDGLSRELDGLDEKGKFIGTRTNRLKGLGNAIVGQVAFEIMLAINRGRNDS
jgi:DNA (cytosine-5)-methyltransferase 1